MSVKANIPRKMFVELLMHGLESFFFNPNGEEKINSEIRYMYNAIFSSVNHTHLESITKFIRLLKAPATRALGMILFTARLNQALREVSCSIV